MIFTNHSECAFIARNKKTFVVGSILISERREEMKFL